MDIHIQQIMPKPLASIQHGAESIWGKDLLLKAGKKVMLNASSGKGKSTFTNVIFGLRSDFTGKLSYDGRDVSTFDVADWTAIRREKISVVFQDLQLFPSLTVAENLRLKNDLTKTFSEERLKEMLATLQIASKWDQPCGLLSMGQQQRVAIIRALCQPFDWLILDEPFSHIDAENAQRCLALIDARCNELNAGFILTTLGDSYGFSYDQELKL